MTMTEHLHSGLNMEESLFRWRQLASSGQKVSGDGLRMSVEEGTARTEWLAEKIVGAQRSGGLTGGGGNPQRWIVGGYEKRLLYL